MGFWSELGIQIVPSISYDLWPITRFGSCLFWSGLKVWVCKIHIQSAFEQTMGQWCKQYSITLIPDWALGVGSFLPWEAELKEAVMSERGKARILSSECTCRQMKRQCPLSPPHFFLLDSLNWHPMVDISLQDLPVIFPCDKNNILHFIEETYPSLAIVI